MLVEYIDTPFILNGLSASIQQEELASFFFLDSADFLGYISRKVVIRYDVQTGGGKTMRANGQRHETSLIAPTSATRIVLVLAILSLCAGGLLAQADRGIITGVVTDQQGAAIPNAPLRITNTNTGVVTTVRSTESGNYASPPLIVGMYSVNVQLAGFKAFTATDLRLDSGQSVRQDIRLQVGELTESITVTVSAAQVNSVNAEVSAAVDRTYYENLPVVGGFLPENMVMVVPGFTPAKDSNGQFHARVAGGQRAGNESYLDGATYGEVTTHSETGERSAPYEAIQEMRVLLNTFSAQYGNTSGGLIEYTTKSGTSRLHGSIYEHFQNATLTARGEINPSVGDFSVNHWGFALGGPAYIPKVYDGRKRTFFYINADFVKQKVPGSTGYITIPPEAFRQGNFAALLQPQQVGKDACGRPVMSGQLFDPASTRDASTCGGPAGIPVRDAFAGNVVPITSQVARNVTALLPPTVQPGIYSNYPHFQDSPVSLRHTVLTRIDHNLSDTTKLAATVNWTEIPRDPTGCQWVGGCTGASSMLDMYARHDIITTKTAHIQLTKNITPTLFNHSTLSYDRWRWTDIYLSTNQGWDSKLGIQGIPWGDAGAFPGIFLENKYTSMGGLAGQSGGGNTSQVSDRWQFLNDTTYVHGKHTLTAGVEFRHERWGFGDTTNGDGGSFNFSFRNTAAFDATGSPIGATGDPYASMLLGQVSSASFLVKTNPDFRRNYIAPWVNDDIKATDRLTLNLGFRFDIRTPRTEKHNVYSTFDPTLPNPAAGGHPGAIEFAGRNGAPSAFEKTDTSTYGPRIGFAYRLGQGTVIRGAYGIFYAGVPMNAFYANPTLGFSTNPTVTDLTNGRQAALFWDKGFPQSAISLPPTIDPAVGVNSSVLWMNPDSLTLPRTQNWTLSVQHQLTDNLLLDVAYIAKHSTRLIMGYDQGDANQNNPAILQQYPVGLLTSDINSPAAAAAGILPPYPGFQGSVAQALRPFPQYQAINRQNLPNGSSTYNALQVKLIKAFKGGFQANIGYTWSKFLVKGNAESAMANDFAQSLSQSAYRREKAYSFDDVPHTLIITYIYEFPFGRGKRFLNKGGISDYALGGWNVSAIHRYESGRPLSITMNNIYAGVLFNYALRPDRVPGISGYGNNQNSSGFDLVNDRYLNLAAFQVPGPGRLGNEGPADSVLRGWATYDEDFSLFKDFRIRESVVLKFGFNATNILNRHEWCSPDTNFSDGPNFGRISGQCNGARTAEIYGRFSF